MIKSLAHAFIAVAGATAFAGAQSIPTAVPSSSLGPGFSLPRIGGSLNYALSASELVSTGLFGGGNGTNAYTNLNGDLAYVSKSQFHPFSAVYSGGVLVSNGSQPTTVYQSLSFSQVLNTKRWNIIVTDSVSYLPQSPTSGLSGVPGVGDLGVDPITVGPNSGIGILTTYGPRVSNSLAATVSRQLNGRFAAQASAFYAIQRFIGDNATLGLNSNTLGGSAGLTYRISARDTLAANYNYTTFSFLDSPYSFTTQGVNVSFNRAWSRRLSTSVYAGPQIIDGSDPAAISGRSVSLAAGANATYQSRTTSYSIAYARGVNNGSGVIPGGFSDNVTATAHRGLSRNWNLSGNLGYSHNSSLPNFRLYQFNGNSIFASVQGARRLGRNFSGFGTYTVQHQTYGGNNTPGVVQNAYSGSYQVFSIGVSYSPRGILLGR